MGDEGHLNTAKFTCNMGSRSGSSITCESVYFVALRVSFSGLCSMNGIKNTPHPQPPTTLPE